MSGADRAGLSRPGKGENPGRIFLDGSSRAAGDPCCFLGCNEVKGCFAFLKKILHFISFLLDFLQTKITNGCYLNCRPELGKKKVCVFYNKHDLQSYRDKWSV